METQWKEGFPLEATFFGQTYDFIKLRPEDVNASYDQLFLMNYYMGWNFFDAYSLPLKLRKWILNQWIERKKMDSEVVNN